ncbi:DNA polymerase eta isoform X2 [Malaclemys terrapin pileata]|uniref:DNA polymerase eta isoform X2 n=1 Tax=Malaclemys terrapin pileata TaxID=2991368 RepID=UPI0023A7EA06|nr:DNA polymerase eta isoform X2 [Malaclemys terrapin pileata]
MSRGRERVVALADMDCFFAQVEQRREPRLRGRPCAVVQYDAWRGGGVIAVSYEARAFGISRGMRADEAQKRCPQLVLARVPEAYGKADLSRYREASVEVMKVMSRFAVIERASIDEAYMDLTSAVQERLKKMQGQPIPAEMLPTTYIQGLPNVSTTAAKKKNVDCKEDLRQRGLHQWLESLPFGDISCPELQLTVGAVIVEEMRAAVEAVTGLSCSAGISHNKALAKLACGLNKPNRQTLVSQASVPQLFSHMPISSIRHLGGKLGASITDVLGVEYMGQLTLFSESQLQTHFGDKTGSWLYDMCRGIEQEPVKPRQLPKSIGCSKNFPGKAALTTQKQVQHWLLQMALELEERLSKDRDQNCRVAKQLTVSIRMQGDQRASALSRCCALPRYDAHKISSDAFMIIRNCNVAGAQEAEWSPPLTFLHIYASKFSEAPTLSPAGIAAFLTSDAQCILPAGTNATSPNAKCTGSPRKEPSKKPMNAIESFFRKAAERQQARVARGPCLPGVPSAEAELSVPDPCGHSEREGLILGKSQTPEALVRHSPKGGSSPSPYRWLPPEELLPYPAETPSAGPASRSTLKTESAGAAASELPEWKEQSLPPSAGFAQGPASSPADQLHCEKCGQQVPVWELLEHMDYHFAVELQSSFSEPSPLRAPAASPSSPAKSKTKAKTLSGSSAKRPRQGVTRTLEFFFKRLPP